MSTSVKTAIKYGCCALVVVLFSALYMSGATYYDGTLQQLFRLLADCLTIPGILLLSAGCMVWISNEGALDGLGYVVSFAIRSLIPGKRLDRDETYADYVERRRSKKVTGYGFLFVSGAVTMGLAVLFTVLFYLV